MTDEPSGRRRTLERARAIALSTPFLAVLIVLVTWPGLFIGPGAGLDPSWNTALQMATHSGLDWGTQFIFTYGPLGFLTAPATMYGGLTALSGIYVVAVLVGFAAAVLWACRWFRLPLPVAVAVAFVASSLAAIEVIVPLAFIVCALALADPPPPRATALVVYGGGVLAGLEVLVKLNSGLAVMLFVLVTVIALPERRRTNLARFAGTFAATFIVLWFATGQGVGNFDDYLRGSFEIISGYSAAMVQGDPNWVLPAALGLIAAIAVCCVAATGGMRRSQRIGLLVLTAILCFSAWKEGFVRFQIGGGHLLIFFLWVLAPWVSIVLAPRWRARWIGLAGFAVTVALYFGANELRPGDRLDPFGNARDAVDQVRTLLDPAERGHARDTARFATAVAYGVDQRTLELIGDRPVDVYPWDASLAWAYDLDWHPLPVFQSYTAYTPHLDRQNADALASDSGPELVLRHSLTPGTGNLSTVFGIDGRYAPYDAPAATLAMLCHFQAVRTTPRYQLLERVPDRCGKRRELGSVDASYGQAVDVPRARPGEVVLARVDGLAPAGAERLGTLLYRAAPRHVVFDGTRAFRLVAANAADGLVVSAPAARDFPRPFAMAPNARTLTFEKDSGFLSGDGGDLTIDFYAVPISR